MHIKTLYIGGWFQRTTLHLSEIEEFLKHGASALDFSQKELAQARAILNLASIKKESRPLDYLDIQTTSNILYRIYEDGLILLEKKQIKELKKEMHAIQTYYEEKLSKAVSLIFSKGAPVPKELAHIKSILPYIIHVEHGNAKDAEQLMKELDDELISTLSEKEITVYEGKHTLILDTAKSEEFVRSIIESHIFFREFTAQLHRYLDIHRIVWDKIAKVKEQGAIRGSEIDFYRSQLNDYEKTITLIGARINQMSSYLKTRQKIANMQKTNTYLNALFQYKFETLQDTHEYIKHLWTMTHDYLNAATNIFFELQQKTTKNTIASLQVITAIGVVAGIFGYLSRDALPAFTLIGIGYFAILLIMTGILNYAVSWFFKKKKYTIKGAEIITEIK